MTLNRVELWIAEHSIRIFLGFALVIVVVGVVLGYVLHEGEETARRLRVLEPQVTRVITLCEPRPAISQRAARHCAEHFRVGLTICRRYPTCRAALEAALRPPKGVIAQTPGHHQGQRPGRA